MRHSEAMRLAVQVLYILLLLLVVPFFWSIYVMLKALGFVDPQPDTTFSAYRTFLPHTAGCCDCAPFYHTQFWSEQTFERFYQKSRSHFVPYAVVPGESGSPDWEAFGIGFGGSDGYTGGEIQQCRTCECLWELSWPENAWRGYFKPIKFTGPEPSFKLRYVPS